MSVIDDDVGRMLFYAIRSNNAYKLTQILDVHYKRDINKSMPDRAVTPLHFACRSNAVDCIRVLIERGAKPDMGLNKEISSPDICCTNANIEAMRLLLDAGADPNTTFIPPFGYGDCKDERTILDDTLQFSCIKFSRLLVDRGATKHNTRCAGTDLRYGRIMDERNKCRTNAILVASMMKICPFESVLRNDVNIMRLIAKHVWTFRLSNDFDEIDAPMKKLKKIKFFFHLPQIC